MEYEVYPAITELKIGAEGIEEVLQNVAVILATPRGSVPLDRDFGIPLNFLDSPTPKSIALFRAEVVKTIEKYEPRAKVIEISFYNDHSNPAKLSPIVKVEIVEEF